MAETPAFICWHLGRWSLTAPASTPRPVTVDVILDQVAGLRTVARSAPSVAGDTVVASSWGWMGRIDGDLVAVEGADGARRSLDATDLAIIDVARTPIASADVAVTIADAIAPGDRTVIDEMEQRLTDLLEAGLLTRGTS